VGEVEVVVPLHRECYKLSWHHPRHVALTMIIISHLNPRTLNPNRDSPQIETTKHRVQMHSNPK